MNPSTIHSGSLGEATRAMKMTAWVEARMRIRNWMADFLAVTKARANVAVVATTFVGFALHADPGADWWLLIHTLMGVSLLAGAAAVANQTLERKFDARMARTRNRPLAAGRMGAPAGALLSGALATGGCVWLGAAVNSEALFYAGLAFVIYVFAYTPLKRRTPLCTMAGSVSGALPLLVGWAATETEFGMWTAVSSAILFFWQVPHFMAIAWWRRSQYANAGYRVLARNDDGGLRTAAFALAGCATVAIISFVPAVTGHAGQWYGAGVAAAGAWFGFYSVRFLLRRDGSTARSLFVASLYCLPALYVLMLLCKI